MLHHTIIDTLLNDVDRQSGRALQHINSIVIEENVLASQGLKTLRAAEKFILEAGYTPKRRDLNFDFSKYQNQEPVYDPNKVKNLEFA